MGTGEQGPKSTEQTWTVKSTARLVHHLFQCCARVCVVRNSLGNHSLSWLALDRQQELMGALETCISLLVSGP